MEGRRKRKGEKRATFAPPLDGAGPPDAFHPGFRHPWRGSVTRGYGSTAPSGPPSRSGPGKPRASSSRGYGSTAPSGPPSRSGVLPTGKQNPYWALMPNGVGPIPASLKCVPKSPSTGRESSTAAAVGQGSRSGRESPEGEKQAAFGSGREAPKGRNRPPSDRDGRPRRGL
jgi:hypothetical protein